MTIEQEFVDYIAKTLVNNKEAVKVDRSIDERGVLLTLHVDDDDLGRVIGRGGSTAQSFRTLLRALGSKNDARYNLRIADGKTDDQPIDSTASTGDDSDFAQESSPKVEEVEEPSALDKAKKELDELDDLDV